MHDNIRRPCTWCPATSTCEIMNQYSGYCATGQTYRDTCPIVADNMPECVNFTYSFWVSYNAPLQNVNQCNLEWAKGLGTMTASNQTVEMCNGDYKELEMMSTGWGWYPALILSKNIYGLEVEVNYDVWFSADYGEDRRRIETEIFNDKKWLCNSYLNYQAFLMQYQVTKIDNSSGAATRFIDMNVLLIAFSTILLLTRMVF